jgi:hypothetical protein
VWGIAIAVFCVFAYGERTGFMPKAGNRFAVPGLEVVNA